MYEPRRSKIYSFKVIVGECKYISLRLLLSITYAKVHGSVSVDALQRKEAEESACGKVHEPAFKVTEIHFQEKLLCNPLVKMEITDLLGLILEMSMHNFVEIFLE